MGGRIELLQGDCRVVLPILEAQSVQCCVTSPPYWGLRDYGTDEWQGGFPWCDHKMFNAYATGLVGTDVAQRNGKFFKEVCRKCGARRIDAQLGMEATKEEYIETMVAVFREIWRVLKDDGTLWLNLGSSYASSNTSPIQSPELKRVLAYDIDDKGQANYRAPDGVYLDLCDGCRDAIQSRHDRNADNAQPIQRVLQQHELKDRDSVQSDGALGVERSEQLYAQASTNHGSLQQPQAECCHCANCGACLSVLCSSTRDASLCARKLAYTRDSVQPAHSLAYRNSDRELSSLAHLYSAITHYKSKDLVNMPFWLAEALRLDGWYLRSDIIWHKPNPMPESVTDRPSKSHEYIFLLAKQERYFYDADAIREPHAEPWRGNGERESENGVNRGSLEVGISWVPKERQYNPAGRNKRSVWTVATQPTSEAHFATFPEDLIKPCILAGTKPGDTVLDPFAGSGTTGKVALECGRSAVLIELSPDYVNLARARTNVTAGFF